MANCGNCDVQRIILWRSIRTKDGVTFKSTEAGVFGVNQEEILGSELYCILQINKMCFNLSVLEIVYCANEHQVLSVLSFCSERLDYHLSLTQPGASRM